MKKRSWIFILIFFSLFILFGIFYNEFNKHKYINKYFDSNYKYASETKISLKENEKITQMITIDDNVEYIAIPFEIDYYEDRIGEFIVTIKKDNQLISRYKVTNKLLEDSKFLINTKNLKSGTYEIGIEHSKIYGDTKIIGKECSINCSKVNNVGKDFQIAIYLKYLNKSSIIFFYGALFGILLIIMFITLKIIKKNIPIAKKFLFLAIPIYILYLFAIPPMAVHDEKGHWVRVFEITEGNIIASVQNDRMGSELPNAILLDISSNNHIKYNDVSFNKKIDYNDTNFISDETIFMYRPMQYFPQIIGVATAKLVTNKSVIVFYCGRICNLIVCLLFLYFSIKLIPYLKKLIFLLSFIPVAIEGFVGLTGDGLIIAGVFLFVSYILYLNENKVKIRKKDILFLSLLSIFISCSKMVYIPIVLLLFLLKDELFKTKKQKIIFICLILFMGMILDILWINSINKYIEIYTDGKSIINLKKAITNPIHFFLQIIYSMEHNGLTIIMETFGSKMLHYEYIQNNALIPLTYLILSIIIFLNEEKSKNKLNLLLIICIIIVEIIHIFSSLYFYWSDTYSFNITGVQGRYFILLIPLIYMLLNQIFGKKIKLETKKLEQIIIVCCAITNYIVIMKIILESI